MRGEDIAAGHGAAASGAGVHASPVHPTGQVRPAKSPRAALARHEPETFRTSRLLDFASQRELTAQIGHPPAMWPQVAVKELVDNALDAAEQAGVPPRVKVTVTPGMIEVTDNGPGLAGDVVDGVLDFAVRVSSREAYVGPTRGAQGNALKTLLVMPFVLDGKAGRVEVASRGVLHRIGLAVDPIAQEPRAEVRREASLVKSGAVVRVHWPRSASSILAASTAALRAQLYKFAVFNPHLTLTARVLEAELAWEATDPVWQRWRPCDPPPAHWYDPPRFERLVAALIHADRRAGRVRTVRELVAGFRGLSGTGKQKAILGELDLARASLEDLVGPDRALDRDRLERLLGAMRAASKAPRAEALGVIGPDHLLARLDLGEVGRTSFVYRKRVDADPLSPRVAEIAFAFDEDRLEGRLLLCGLNNSPALSGAGAFRELGVNAGVDGLGGLLAHQYAGADAPIAFAMHLTGARLPFTDRGKSAVSL